MKKIQLIILILVLFYFSSQAAASDILYVTDSFTITLRTGPSTENKIIRSLSSGQKLEVLEAQENWSRVMVTLKSGTELEGWVLSRYLMERTPWETQAKALLSENEKLKGALSKLNKEQKDTEKDKKDISAQFSQTTGELNTLKKEYESLKKASSEYLALKAKYDENLLKLQTTEQRLNDVELENDSIKKSKSHIWFGIGALVLLFGMILGSIIGRKFRKKSSSYY